MKTQMSKLGIQVELGKEATVESVLAYEPHAVVIATGTKRTDLNFPGAKKNNVVQAEDVLTGKAKVGDTIAVVGGGLVGCETAEFLADQGKKVTIVEMLDALSLGMESIHSIYLPQRLVRRDVNVLLGAKAVDVAAPGLIISRGEDNQELLACDTIVLAVTPKPNQELYNALQGKVSQFIKWGIA